MKRRTAKNPMLNAGDQEQEVLTPPDIIARVEEAFGGTIALDPCSPSKNEPSFYAALRYREADNGLILPWMDRTFFNPPFNRLQEWLEKAQIEAKRGARIVGLVPFRSRRKWFQPAMRSCTSITFEGAVKFIGHKAAIPADIVLMSWNCSVKGSTIGSFAKGEW